MPYQHVNELPGSVRDKLPIHAQEIYLNAFNNAWKQYADPSQRKKGTSQEETAHRVAWTAVKAKYHKTSSGQWEHKGNQ